MKMKYNIGHNCFTIYSFRLISYQVSVIYQLYSCTRLVICRSKCCSNKIFYGKRCVNYGVR